MRYQIRHARVQFGGDVILQDVNFEVHDREKIAIVGRNGCGKTTLLRLIAGDIEMSNPDSDEECGITMAGRPGDRFPAAGQLCGRGGNRGGRIKKSFCTGVCL